MEGIFSFRTPPGAVLIRRRSRRRRGLRARSRAPPRSGNDEQRLYQGSTEDPAPLVGRPGTYNARLYPITPGDKRRRHARYAEWFTRQGPKSDRRLYVHPMAAEARLAPRIEELRVRSTSRSPEADKVRAGMAT